MAQLRSLHILRVTQTQSGLELMTVPETSRPDAMSRKGLGTLAGQSSGWAASRVTALVPGLGPCLWRGDSLGMSVCRVPSPPYGKPHWKWLSAAGLFPGESCLQPTRAGPFPLPAHALGAISEPAAPRCADVTPSM